MDLHPTYKITIGDYVFRHAHMVRIFSSRKTIADTAFIELPAKYKTAKIHEVINVGDPVQIYLAYGNNLRPVADFVGYVSEPLQYDFPVRIMCKDQMWQLERSRPASQILKNTTIEQVIKTIGGTGNISVPQIQVDKFEITKDRSKAAHLQAIKDNYGLDVYYRKGTLYAGLAYNDTSVVGLDTVKYHLQRNVINNDLRYRSEDDVRIRLKVISLLPDNTKLEYEVGDEDGELRTLHFYNIKNGLKTLAEQHLNSMKFEGYTGSLRAFGIPYCEHGMKAEITDSYFGIKGTYYIDAVTVSSGYEDGFRRNVEIGKKA